MTYTRLNPAYDGPHSLTTQNLSSGTITYCRWGRMVCIEFDNIKVSSAGSTVVGTMPNGYKPTVSVHPYIRDNGGNTPQSWIEPNGIIHIHFLSTTVPHAGFVVYMTA